MYVIDGLCERSSAARLDGHGGSHEPGGAYVPRLVATVNHTDRNSKCCAFSPDGSLLALGGASKDALGK